MPRSDGSKRRKAKAPSLRGFIVACALAAGLAQTAAFAQVPAPPSVQEANPDVFGEEVVLTAKPVLFVAGKSSWGGAFPTLVGQFKSISSLLGKQNLKAAGPAMTIFLSVDNNGFQYQAAVPVSEAPANLPRGAISAGQSPAGKAVKFVHRGDYDSLDMLYEAITHYIDERKFEKLGPFVEEYVTDPVTTPEDKLVVNVYVLVK